MPRRDGNPAALEEQAAAPRRPPACQETGDADPVPAEGGVVTAGPDDIVQVVDPDGEGGTLTADALRRVRGLPRCS